MDLDEWYNKNAKELNLIPSRKEFARMVWEGCKQSIMEKAKKLAGTPYTEAFEEFWKRYPRKTGKGGAWLVFKKLDAKTHEAIHKALDWQIHLDQWTRDNGQFIPHAQTWLRQRRWEDEPQLTKPKEKFMDDSGVWRER
jgi:hypothetical protein